VQFTAQIGSKTVSSKSAVVVIFKHGQVLEFDSKEQAIGLLNFYNTNKRASSDNPAKAYCFEAGNWVELSN
jgi:hypothetical protein